MKCCDKYIYVQRWGSQKDVQFEVPCVSQELNIQTDAVKLPNDFRRKKNVSCQFSDFPSFVIPNIDNTQEILSKEFKIAVANNDSQSSKQFTVLTKSSSGTLAMELDEQIVELIQNKSNPLFMSLNKTNSGNMVLNIDSKSDLKPDNWKVMLRTTQSGTNFLEINKDLIDIIKGKTKYISGTESTISTIIRKNVIPDCPFDSIPFLEDLDGSNKFSLSKAKHNRISDSGSQTRGSCSKYALVQKVSDQCMKERYISDDSSNQFLLDDNDEINNEKYRNQSICDKDTEIEDETLQQQTYKLSEIPDYSLLMQQLFENGNVIITLQLKVKNELLSKFESVVTKSLWGTVEVNLPVKRNYFCNIPFDGDEYPVYISKTESNTFIINIDQCSAVFNAVLKKSVRGNIMLIPTIPRAKNPEEMHKISLAIEKFFKVTLNSNKNGHIEPPAVLKLTLSNNFIIILDKEFENGYKKSLQSYVGTERKCCVLLEKSCSGYLLNLNGDHIVSTERLNAVLVTSKSGNIKIVVNGPVFKCKYDNRTNKCSMSSTHVYGVLLEKLQSSALNSKYLTKPKFLVQKSVSDTQLYERIRVKLQLSKDLLCTPSTVLKKSDSGQYAIILNKESKKTFVKNLTSFLVSNPKGRIPITRTESGEIMIDWNNYNQVKCQYGALKITPSGNVYIIVDTQAVKEMGSNLKLHVQQSNAVDTRFLRLLQSVNREVCTNCNGRPVDGGCEISKCVCAKLPFERLDWENSCVDNSKVQSYQSVCCISYNRENGKFTTAKDELCKRPTFESGVKYTEQCCYIFDGICANDDRKYNNATNDMLNNSVIFNDHPEQITPDNVSNKLLDDCAWSYEEEPKLNVLNLKPDEDILKCQETKKMQIKPDYVYSELLDDFTSFCEQEMKLVQSNSENYIRDSQLPNKIQITPDYTSIELFDDTVSSYEEKRHINVVKFKPNDEIKNIQVGRAWDSLSYLPPQLPPFLRNVRYR